MLAGIRATRARVGRDRRVAGYMAMTGYPRYPPATPPPTFRGPVPHGCSARAPAVPCPAPPMAETLYQIMGRHRAEPLPQRKPSWLKVKAPGGDKYKHIKQTLRSLDLYTAVSYTHLRAHET